MSLECPRLSGAGVRLCPLRWAARQDSGAAPLLSAPQSRFTCRQGGPAWTGSLSIPYDIVLYHC